MKELHTLAREVAKTTKVPAMILISEPNYPKTVKVTTRIEEVPVHKLFRTIIERHEVKEEKRVRTEKGAPRGWKLATYYSDLWSEHTKSAYFIEKVYTTKNCCLTEDGKLVMLEEGHSLTEDRRGTERTYGNGYKITTLSREQTLELDHELESNFYPANGRGRDVVHERMMYTPDATKPLMKGVEAKGDYVRMKLMELRD